MILCMNRLVVKQKNRCGIMKKHRHTDVFVSDWISHQDTCAVFCAGTPYLVPT